LMIFLTIPVSGIFAWNYNILAKRITGGFRLRKYMRMKNPDYLALRNDYNELIGLLAKINDAEK